MVIYVLNLALLAVLLIIASPQVTWVGFGRELLQNAANLTPWVTLMLNQLSVSDTAGKLRFLLDLQKNLGGCIPFERWMHEALYHRNSDTTPQTSASSEGAATSRPGRH